MYTEINFEEIKRVEDLSQEWEEKNGLIVSSCVNSQDVKENLAFSALPGEYHKYIEATFSIFTEDGDILMMFGCEDYLTRLDKPVWQIWPENKYSE